MNLKQVKAGEHLHWPSSVSASDASYRGGAGYVVDLDAPCERDVFLRGQEHKVGPAEPGSKATPITHAIALGAIKRAIAAKSAPAKSGTPVVASVGGALPGIDVPTRKPAKD